MERLHPMMKYGNFIEVYNNYHYSYAAQMNVVWCLHRNPEGLESDLRTKICQNSISSGVGRQHLKFLLHVCYLSEGRKLLMNTRNNSGGLTITRHKFPDHMERFKMVGNFSRVANAGLACMSVARPS